MADIITALGLIAEPFNFVCLIFGVGVGIMFGAMPGLSVNMGLALLLPLAFAFKGMAGILMLLGIYCGAIYGGSISAILLKTPGTPASVATTWNCVSRAGLWDFPLRPAPLAVSSVQSV